MIQIKNVSKQYPAKQGSVNALVDIDLEIKQGEFLVVRGPSGSGKTTLLLSIGGMLCPTKGQVIVDESDIYSMTSRQRAKFRADNIGFVFQMFHLVPYLNTVENILLPTGMGTGRAGRSEAEDLIKRLNLSERTLHKPSELSAGEKQRTAIARALLNQPQIVLADEPTGNLDPENAAEIIEHLKAFQQNGGTVIIVTHGTMVDRYADRIVHLRNGRFGVQALD